MPTRHLDGALVDRVATAALGWELEHDYWERQGAMTALLSSGHPQAEPTVRRWLDRAVETQTSAGWLCYGATTNLSFGSFRVMDTGIMRGFERSASCAAYFTAPLGLLHEVTGEHGYLDAAVRQLEAVLAGPRTSLGIVDDAVTVAGVRALDAVAAIVAADGSIGRVVLPPGGPGVPMSTMPLAVSFFLLAAHHLRAAAELEETLA